MNSFLNLKETINLLFGVKNNPNQNTIKSATYVALFFCPRVFNVRILHLTELNYKNLNLLLYDAYGSLYMYLYSIG
jgi:hypothetical protein